MDTLSYKYPPNEEVSRKRLSSRGCQIGAPKAASLRCKKPRQREESSSTAKPAFGIRETDVMSLNLNESPRSASGSEAGLLYYFGGTEHVSG